MQKKNIVRLFAIIMPVIAATFPSQSSALNNVRVFSAFLEDSEWQVQESALECGLTQQIPEFGKGVFSKRAGENLQFYLKPFNHVLPPGEADLVAEAPAWKPNLTAQSIATLEINDTLVPLQVEKPYAAIMLNQLRQGLMPSISTRNSEQSAADEQVKVVISAVNFQQAYREYMSCLSQLLPVGFRQIARSAVFFDTNNAALNDAIREQLDLIARYVKADKNIKRIFIDGHTDDIGDKRLNKRLSQRRANVVAGYFKQAGVDNKLLVSRYHGDRYPALKNDSAENRARNRRVTIRLERN